SLSDGSFIFQNLGNTTYSVCLGAPPAGQGPYNQTLPVGGSGCSGAGYTFMFNSQFMTCSVNNFGEQLQVPYAVAKLLTNSGLWAVSPRPFFLGLFRDKIRSGLQLSRESCQQIRRAIEVLE